MCCKKNVTSISKEVYRLQNLYTHIAKTSSNNVPLMETNETLNSGRCFHRTFKGFRKKQVTIDALLLGAFHLLEQNVLRKKQF